MLANLNLFMKKQCSLCLILCFFSLTILAQNKLPVINANSVQSYIIEKGQDILDWYLSPEAKPDIYKLSKSLEATQMAFFTDIDSVKIELNPGEQFDFIVLLNGKDSCYNRFIHAAPITKYLNLQPATHDTILFELIGRGNINIPVVLNRQDSLNLMFDSNTSGLTLKEEAIIEKTKLLNGQKGNEEYNFRELPTNNTFQMGDLIWEGLPIYSTKLSGHGTDGRFGWDILDGRIIEIDYEQERFIVHSALPNIPKGYSKFTMTFTQGYFYIEGDIVVNGKKIKSRFLVDSGYNRAILLDPVLMKNHGFPEDLNVYKKTELRNGGGEVFVTKIFETDKICFGRNKLKRISTQILPENLLNPAGMNAHTIGNELLKRFNMILDFQSNLIYLRPNILGDLPYTDAH